MLPSVYVEITLKKRISREAHHWEVVKSGWSFAGAHMVKHAQVAREPLETRIAGSLT